jgi:hypothetical protein
MLGWIRKKLLSTRVGLLTDGLGWVTENGPVSMSGLPHADNPTRKKDTAEGHKQKRAGLKRREEVSKNFRSTVQQPTH